MNTLTTHLKNTQSELADIILKIGETGIAINKLLQKGALAGVLGARRK